MAITKKSIEEAIKYHKEFSKDLQHRKEYKAKSKIISEAYKTMAQDEEQLVEWLTQLKTIKEAYESDYQIQDLIEVCVKFWG